MQNFVLALESKVKTVSMIKFGSLIRELSWIILLTLDVNGVAAKIKIEVFKTYSVLFITHMFALLLFALVGRH